MLTRDASRFVGTFCLLVASVVTAISCGSSTNDSSSSGKGGRGPDASGGGFVFGDGGGNGCKPKTCAELGYSCGPNGDGCGNIIECGSCGTGQFCGGGGYSKCGSSSGADGAAGQSCKPKTCADFPGGTCGQQSDGCGGVTVSCSGCKSPEFCGGGGSSLCGLGPAGDAGRCQPKTCADYPAGTCGEQSDGCGALTASCTTCTSPQFCGGNPAKPGTCGGNLLADAGTGVKTCKPKTCADFPLGTCGVQGDGCGGMIAACATCKAPAFCGGGGSSQCGTGTTASTDGGGTGGGSCTPKTCAAYPKGTCGRQSDGCGGLTPNCGTCAAPQSCGGGGQPGVCGGTGGTLPDGAVISQCVPATCKSLGYTCGVAGDGCGGVIGPCGPACTGTDVCGGGGKPNVCGSNITCTGLCLQQAKCAAGVTTTLTGTVRAGLQESGSGPWVPAGTKPDPVPGVLVYVPTAALKPFDTNPNAPKVQCNQCGADVSGSPLVIATTDYNGNFTLKNVPVSKTAGDTIPLVIQLGKWRRQYAFPITKSCAANTLPQDLNLPSTSAEGDIPLTAISTGSVDAIECVLLKMGVAEEEFTSLPTWQAEIASGTKPKPGRIHIYTANGGAGNGNPGAILAPQQDETVLMGTGTTGGPANGTYMMYDQILLPCWGDAITKNGAELANLGYYGDHGGHFFATHYSYSWLYQNANSALMSVANWDPRANTNTNPNPNGVAFTGNVSRAVPITVPASNPGMFVKWLNFVGALANGNPAGAPPAAPTVTITAGRHDVDSVAGKSVDWIDGTDPNPRQGSSSQMLLHFTFDMPVAAASTAQCGHGIYSDFHVNTAGRSNGTNFPSECDRTALTSQERILEYMIWDLASCIGPPPTATCTPKTCAAFPAGTCGRQGDGCGGLTPNCGTCPTGQVCGGSGTANVCGGGGGGSCAPLTCSSYAPGTCGQQSDGCGGLTSACTCPTGQTCGGGGTPGKCGSPGTGGGGGCKPLTCADYPTGTCGPQSDGCGALTPDCNPCPSGQTCGGCGTPGQCCKPPAGGCVPQKCPASIKCGPASDGCGSIIASCGTCTPPQTCGGGGVAGQCGGANGCVPQTCAQQGLSCGPAGDGCGNLIPNGCGTCTPPQTCGGGGTPGKCGGGATCVPKTCSDLGIACGPAGDGCGDLIPSCGTCPSPQTCGGGGVPGQCGGGIIR